ncbi:hypothetical protein FB451DRAFT_1557106 [Mycena latifolia]|nr:hypothetical protein FB451DRAFT_1557106 [Mycena latifolia]
MDPSNGRTVYDTSINPLRIQELLDQCIDFLRDSPTDLKACAMVARSWSFAAQVHIFGQIYLGIGLIRSDDPWNRLHDALRLSPHLIRHIRRLTLDSGSLTPEAFSTVCEFSFTHLRSVSIYDREAHLTAGLAIQQLLSLPTLTHVKIVVFFRTPSSFLQIWESCSPIISHLVLHCHPFSLEAGRPIPPSHTRPITLNTLKVGPQAFIHDWLRDDLCPLDVSRLRGLSLVYGQHELFRWQRFAPALRTIEVLDFCPKGFPEIMDFSALPNLIIVRVGGIGHITGLGLQQSLDVFSTIRSPTRIRKIIIWNARLNHRFCEQLDSKLVSLQVQPLPTLELEMALIEGDITSASGPSQFFPRMASRNLLAHHGDDQWYDWFENFVGM